MTEQINPGDLRTVRVAFSTVDDAGVATAADPTAVSLKWWHHGDVETTWVYPTNAQIVKTGTGAYKADVPITEVGLYYFEWIGDGVAQAVEQGWFEATSYRRTA